MSMMELAFHKHAFINEVHFDYDGIETTSSPFSFLITPCFSRSTSYKDLVIMDILFVMLGLLHDLC